MKVYINSCFPKDVAASPLTHTADSIKWRVFKLRKRILYTNLLSDLFMLHVCFLKFAHLSGSLSSLFAASTSMPSKPLATSKVRWLVAILHTPRARKVRMQKKGLAHQRLCSSPQSRAKSAIPECPKGGPYSQATTVGHLCQTRLDPQPPSIHPRAPGPCR